MKISAFGKTDPGPKRSVNEDVFLIDADLGLYLISDGAGAAGRSAAETVARAVQFFFKGVAESIAAARADAGQRHALLPLVYQAVEAACSEISILSADKPELQGSAATLTFLLELGEQALLAHVGDSRLYLRRGGVVHLLTRDHTLARELYERGLISFEKLSSHPMRYSLTRSVTGRGGVQVDTLLFDLLAGDELLLCTDGLHGALRGDEELAEIWKASALESACGELIALGHKREVKDNLTALLIRAGDAAAVASERARCEEVTLKIEILRQLFLFRDLELQELLHVLEQSYLCEVPQGQVLIHEGALDQSLFIIIAGSVSVERGGRELAALGAGNHFGEMSLLERQPRSATVTAREAARLLVIERDAFVGLVQEHKSIGVKLLWGLAQELSRRLALAGNS